MLRDARERANMSIASNKVRTAKRPTAQVGDPTDAERITVNLAADISQALHGVAERHRVSESSIVEIALRELFRRVSPLALGNFLHENGGCLRRKRS
jgi:hypothetical protein